MYRNRCLRCSLLELSLYNRFPSSRSLNTVATQSKAIVRSKAYFPPPQSTASHPGKPSKALTRGGHGVHKPPHLRPITRGRVKRKRDDEPVDDGAPRGGDVLRGRPPKDRHAVVKSGDGKNEVARVDRFKVAEQVRALLEKDKFAAAMEYTREKTKYCDTVVPFNHLIEYKMSRGDCSKAYKIYIEMKKRRIQPDSYTIGILLNGFAKSAKHSKSLERALSLYYSISSPGSLIPPSVVHTNSALKVCLKMKDMDALWSIAEKMPNHGPRQPDNLTYTIILNGLRLGCDEGIQKAVVDGRTLWDGVVSKWAAGSLVVDEELVCAMGRLLLASERPEDWDDVLTLCANQFEIPRLLPKMGTKARKMLHLPPVLPRKSTSKKSKAENTEKQSALATLSEHEATAENQENEVIEDEGWESDEEGELTPESARLKWLLSNKYASNEEAPTSLTELIERGASDNKQLVATKAKFGTPATPGNNALSLLMNSCASMRAYSTALEYWTLLTDSYGVKPDMDNFQWKLRVYAELRDHKACLQTLRTMQALSEDSKLTGLNPKAFFIALNACRRRKTESAFMDAVGLLDMMARLDIEVKPKILSAFIYTAILTGYGKCYKIAWDRLGPLYYDFEKLTEPEGRGGVLKQPTVNTEKEQSFDEDGMLVDDAAPKTHLQTQFDLLRNMVRLADYLLDPKSGLKLDISEQKAIVAQRGKYNKLLTDYFNFDAMTDGESVGAPRYMQKHRLGKFGKDMSGSRTTTYRHLKAGQSDTGNRTKRPTGWLSSLIAETEARQERSVVRGVNHRYKL